ncbi:MAG TPA: SBBP repeat-containing protein, partial [Terriglobales bacterium]|nr:SBBP repeat-containing protein [Terriglobales bacterium]
MKLNVRVAGDRFRLAGVWVTACLLVMAAGNLLYLAGRGPITASVPDNRIRSLWDGEGQSGRHPYVQGIGQVVPAATKLGSQIAFPNVPLSFEANQGQTDAQVKFLSRGGGYTLFLTQDEAVLKLSSVVSRRSSAKHSTVSTQHSEATTSVVRMKLVGASRQADIRGANQLPSRSNYFVGNDPAKWRRNVAQFARVRYGQVYPGIDLVYYGNQGRLEYDFVIAPGADPQQIGWQIEGANNLHLSEKGDLVAETAAGDVQLHAPMVYQNIDDQKRAVTGKFVLSLGHRVQFRLGQYDRRRELVIDPQLTFAAYFGGNADEGCAFITGAYTSPVAGCPAVAVDGNLNRYVALTTTSATFPTAPAGYQTGLQGTANVFVAKFNAAGVLQNETYLGGDTVDSPVGIRVDPAGGNVYVAGNTTSSNFPFKNEFQSGPLSTANHVFVSVLSNDLSALNYSTYLSGTGTDTATGLAIDSTAGAYVSGYTTSTEHGTGFPSTSTAFQVSPAAANQFFFTKINTAATGAGSVVYSSYLGGSAGGTGRTVGGGIAADSAGNVYLTGGTDFTDMPVLNAYQATSRGGMDAFVAKFNVNQTGPASRKYVTYLGGTGDDIGYGIAVDASGNAYVAGGTSSTNFTVPTSPAPFQSTNAGSEDAFVAKIGTGGNTLSYFSYLGGTATDVAYAIAVDVDQAAHITGVTASSNFPQVDAVTGTGAGSGASAFVALLQTTFSGTTGGYSSYLESAGANGNTDGTGIAVDLNANTYIIGETSSSGFPATNGSTLSGGSDAFLARILPTATGITITASTSVTSGSTAGIGNQVTFTY